MSGREVVAAQWRFQLLWMRKCWRRSEFKGGMAAKDELHDLPDDAVLQIVGLVAYVIVAF
jgi:hypothetical protein